MNWQRMLLICGTWLTPFTAEAATSANYSLEPTVVDNGGLSTSSTNYRANSSAAAGGAMGSSLYSDRTGFAGQLGDAVATSIVITAPLLEVGEGGTCQLGVSLVYDDQTTSELPPESITWSVVSGPISTISSVGLITGGPVYQNSPARVSAVFQGFSTTQEVTVTNIEGDNFGSFANDGIPDVWQVQYFGAPPKATAAPTADPDGDGFNNLQAFAFGMNPMQGNPSPVTWIGTMQVNPGAPTQLVTNKNGVFTFRAVYARRKDYESVNLVYTVEFSGDLLTWKASTATPSVLADDWRIQVVSVPYPFSVGGKKARYFRVKVETRTRNIAL
ncbi:MAG: hypothetical protein WCP35_09190 [Verrucomicrobiota bacterium]